MKRDDFAVSAAPDIVAVDVDVTEAGETVSHIVNLETDFDLIARYTVGKKPQTCRVCGAKGMFNTWVGREMFQGTREVFNYFACDACDCLQIETVPEDLGKYYDSDYYSYSPPPIVLPPAGTEPKTVSILDVGCGAGVWLCERAAEGYQNLCGCDPFIEKDLSYANGVKIYKRTIHEMDGQFDMIRLSHSFEHMADPLETLESAKRLLRPGGTLEISSPVHPSLPFEVYGPFWYQLDAPRHIFLHSPKSVDFLAKAAGLELESVDFVGNPWAFGISRLYQRDIPFFTTKKPFDTYFTEEQVHDFYRVSIAAAQDRRSDMANFVLTHHDTVAEAPAATAKGAENASGATMRQIRDLAGTMNEALAYLVEAGEKGTLEQSAYLLHDLLLANSNLIALLDTLAPDRHEE